jgi:sugar phosphate permease
MSAGATASTGRRFYYGWWVVFASASIVFLTGGTFFYGFGLLVSPLTAEFGWSRAALSAAFSLRTEVGGLAAPVVGFAVDRVGVRRLMIGGVVTVAIGFIALSQVQSLAAFYAAVVVIAIGTSASGGGGATVAIAHWFRRQRGRALGLFSFGGGMSGVLVIVFAWLISEFGWRDALIIAAVSQLILGVPLALSIRNRPEDMGLPVDGFSAAGDDSAEESLTEDEGYTTVEALRSFLFWRLAIAVALGNFATTSVVVHQVPFFVDSVGMSTGLAAASVTIMTTLSLAGRLAFGYLADYFPKRIIMAAAMLLIALSLALLASVYHPWQVVYFLPLYSFGFGGSIPARSTIQAEYFGLRSFGAIQGLTLTVATLGGVAGPILAGWLYDTTESYRLAFLLLSAGCLVSVPLVFWAKPVPPRRRPLAPLAGA